MQNESLKKIDQGNPAGYKPGLLIMRRPGRLLFVVGFLFMTLSLHTDEEMRCDGKLLGPGRSRIEVLKYCGEPQDKISYLDEKVNHRRYSEVLVGTFRETRQTGTYVETSRNTVSSDPGQRSKEAERNPVQALPTHTHDETKIVTDTTVVSQSNYTVLSSYWDCQKSTAYIDEYTYNFGTGKFMTFVRFENGRVKSIKFGEYGF